jgi:hypothetical protein
MSLEPKTFHCLNGIIGENNSADMPIKKRPNMYISTKTFRAIESLPTSPK